MIPILLVRHAPTDWNEQGLVQGHTDRPLSHAGRSLAARWALPGAWRDVRCLASPLRRAQETARLLGLEPRPEPRLIEMHWGAWEGRNLEHLRATEPEAIAAAEALGLDLRAPGGESPREVGVRLRSLLRELDRPTVLVAHKGVLRAAYALASGWDMQGRPPQKLLDGRAHEYVVKPDGALAISRLNLPL